MQPANTQQVLSSISYLVIVPSFLDVITYTTLITERYCFRISVIEELLILGKSSHLGAVVRTTESHPINEAHFFLQHP